MSVLTKLIEDRESFSQAYRQSIARRNRWMCVEYAAFVGVVVLFFMQYNRILSALATLVRF